ncbi:MAG: DUF3604 domain-containing protein [Deltaproteobacteria bacterium]
MATESGLRGLWRVLRALFVLVLVIGLPIAVLLSLEGTEQPQVGISERPRGARATQPEAAGKQILFGDLHVHTTYSMDAFFTAMPLLGGEGAHPPADACDFARHCAALDFYAITDHAQELTPAHWAMEKEANRRCNAVGHDATDPDLVVFHGYEWTQIGATPDTHYGHKNVIFRGLGEDEVTPRPITARGAPDDRNPWRTLAPLMAGGRLVDPLHWETYAQFEWMWEQLARVPVCDRNADIRDLPVDCLEEAPTPDILFEKLDEWGYDALVIPHGTAWGAYSPPGTTLAKQLRGKMYDPQRQKLIEVFSGHGNSEQYHSWREFDIDDAGEKVCPEATPDYLPCCRRAAEIMRQRCGDLEEAECEARIETAVALTLDAGIGFDGTFPDAGTEDWLDCGQARSGFKPDYSLRPRGTAQYALALTHEEAGAKRRFRWGFIGSSDNHSGRAATGFKQQGRRRGRTDMIGPRSEFYANLLDPRREPEDPRMPEMPNAGIAGVLAIERTGSFLYPGGVVAVHAASRSRDGIWEALDRRETYATSGPRILLWFDLLGEDGETWPMGSGLALGVEPHFRVRAVGAHRQKPGCPAETGRALSPERMAKLCMGECFHPGDTRHRIERIEVVRVRPQLHAGEDVGRLIEDPWLVLPCVPDEGGCVVEFRDEEFLRSGRDAVYYVRALQEATPAINADNLRTEFDAQGRAVSARPCLPDSLADDCLGEAHERAWSSPIFVDQR